MTQLLALDSAPAGQAAGWRKGENLIDALPYVDVLTPEEKVNVDRLIQEEMKNSSQRPAAYLKDLPPPYQLNFADHPLLGAEMERVKAGIPLNALDDIRYQLNPPPKAQSNSFAAWKEALDNAHSQIGHQHNRVVNLELMLKFGPKAWRVHNARLASSNTRLEAEVAQLKNEVEAVNRERKLQQTTAGSKLVDLEAQWQALVTKNTQIERACRALETEIAAAKAQSPAAAAASDSKDPAAAMNDSKGDNVSSSEGADIRASVDTTAGMVSGDTPTEPLVSEAAPSEAADGEAPVTPPDQMAPANGPTPGAPVAAVDTEMQDAIGASC